MRSKWPSPRRFTRFARVSLQTVMIDSAYSFRRAGLPQGVTGQLHHRGHEDCDRAPRKKLEFFKTLAPPQLRLGKFRPPGMPIASLHGQRICGVNRAPRQRKPEQNA